MPLEIGANNLNTAATVIDRIMDYLAVCCLTLERGHQCHLFCHQAPVSISSRIILSVALAIPSTSGRRHTGFAKLNTWLPKGKRPDRELNARATMVGFARITPINLGGIAVAELQGNFVQIRSATKIQILFSYRPLPGTTRKKKTASQKNFTQTLSVPSQNGVSELAHCRG